MVLFRLVKGGLYLLEASAVGKTEGQQGLRLDEDMCQLGAAVQVQVRQLWTGRGR